MPLQHVGTTHRHRRPPSQTAKPRLIVSRPPQVVQEVVRQVPVDRVVERRVEVIKEVPVEKIVEKNHEPN